MTRAQPERKDSLSSACPKRGFALDRPLTPCDSRLLSVEDIADRGIANDFGAFHDDHVRTRSQVCRHEIYGEEVDVAEPGTIRSVAHSLDEDAE